MNILDKISIKYDFRTSIKNLKFICGKASECLSPLKDGAGEKQVRSSLYILSLYLNQINSIKKDIIFLRNEYPALLTGYMKSCDAAMKMLESLHNEIKLMNSQFSLAALNELEKQIKLYQ